MTTVEGGGGGGAGGAVQVFWRKDYYLRLNFFFIQFLEVHVRLESTEEQINHCDSFDSI